MARAIQLLISLIVLSAAITCYANDVSFLQGKWKVKYAGPNGIPREAQVMISGTAGTWQILATSRANSGSLRVS
jgi:hypothetical protein